MKRHGNIHNGGYYAPVFFAQDELEPVAAETIGPVMMARGVGGVPLIAAGSAQPENRGLGATALLAIHNRSIHNRSIHRQQYTGGRVIYDASGRPLYRKIGFEGGLMVETNPKKRETIYCVSGTFVEVSETEGAEAGTGDMMVSAVQSYTGGA